MPPMSRDWGRYFCLEAVERALLLFLRRVELRHSLLERLSCSFSTHAHLALLLDCLQARSGATTFLVQTRKFVFERGTFLAPAIHFRLGAVGASFEVDECLFKRRRELFLSEEVLLDRADASFLFLKLLRYGWCWIMRSMSRSRRRMVAWWGCCSLKRWRGGTAVEAVRNRRGRGW